MAVRAIPEIGPWPIHLVPGIRTPAEAGPDGWMRADLMRGEECETFGALSRLKRRGLLEMGRAGQVFLWPGSHTKLVEVDPRGRITRSQTSLAGEFLEGIARHTLIAASLLSRWPDQLDLEAAEAGARRRASSRAAAGRISRPDRGLGMRTGPGAACILLDWGRGRRRYRPPHRRSDPGPIPAGMGRRPAAAATPLRPLAWALASRTWSTRWRTAWPTTHRPQAPSRSRRVGSIDQGVRDR